MTTLKDQMVKLTDLKVKLSVWEALAAYLDDTFISKDGRPAAKAIKPKDCLIDIVPEEVLEDILQVIGEMHIADIKKQVDEIENGAVVFTKWEAPDNGDEETEKATPQG